MSNKNKELKQELIRHISMIMIGILCIPIIVIFILIQQSIFYNRSYKENVGKQAEEVAIKVANEIETALDKHTQILDVLPYINDKSKYDELYEKAYIEKVYYYKDKLDKERWLNKLSFKSLKVGVNIISTLSEQKLIIDKPMGSRGDGHVYIVRERLLQELIEENEKNNIFIFNKEQKLIYNMNPLKKGRNAEQIIKSSKFNVFFKKHIWNRSGYNYYDTYGKYGKQTIVSYAPIKDPLSLDNIGSLVVFMETSKFISDEKNLNIILFIVMFVGGTILIKLIFKFSEIIIGQFMKITDSFNKASKEKEVMREKLLISEKLASLGRITSGIAHEIGNPLSAILSTSQALISYDMPKEKTKEFICKIQNDALRIDSLIKEFLYFHRNNKGNYMALDINEVLEKAIDNIPDNRKSKDVELYKDFSKNLPDILGDSKRLSMAFTNVILNSFQAIKNGGIIHIRTTKQNSLVYIKIKDTGHGIGKDHIEKIFDPFYTTKEVGKGFGLGLYICQQIIEAHNGNIQISSEENKGTEFTIKLPFLEDKGERINET